MFLSIPPSLCALKRVAAKTDHPRYTAKGFGTRRVALCRQQHCCANSTVEVRAFQFFDQQRRYLVAFEFCRHGNQPGSRQLRQARRNFRARRHSEHSRQGLGMRGHRAGQFSHQAARVASPGRSRTDHDHRPNWRSAKAQETETATEFPAHGARQRIALDLPTM